MARFNYSLFNQTNKEDEVEAVTNTTNIDSTNIDNEEPLSAGSPDQTRAAVMDASPAVDDISDTTPFDNPAYQHNSDNSEVQPSEDIRKIPDSKPTSFISLSTKKPDEERAQIPENNANKGDIDSEEEKEFLEIPLSLIDLAEDNPYRIHDKTDAGKEELEALANNIAVVGLLHPLLVNKKRSGRYVIISGERRFKAVKQLGWDSVECLAVDVDDIQTEKRMLHSANMYRNLSPAEMCSLIYELEQNYKSLLDSGKVTRGKIAFITKSLNISRQQMHKYMRFMANFEVLTDKEKTAFFNGELSLAKANRIIEERTNPQKPDVDIPATSDEDGAGITSNVNSETTYNDTHNESSAPAENNELTNESDSSDLPVSFGNDTVSSSAQTHSEPDTKDNEEPATTDAQPDKPQPDKPHSFSDDHASTDQTEPEISGVEEQIAKEDDEKPFTKALINHEFKAFEKEYSGVSNDGSVISGFLVSLSNVFYIIPKADIIESPASNHASLIKMKLIRITKNSLKKVENS